MVSSEIVNEGKSNKIFRKTRKKYPKWTKRVVKVDLGGSGAAFGKDLGEPGPPSWSQVEPSWS